MHAMHETPVGIWGASGFAGVALSQLLSQHKYCKIQLLSAERQAGSLVRKHLNKGVCSNLSYTNSEEAIAAVVPGLVAFLATPAEVSLSLAPRLLERGCRVIDLSGAFRIDEAAEFTRAYQLPYAPLQREAVYGLPELYRAKLREARFVANPGCYPTAAVLALGPLLRAGLIDPGDLIVDAASGVTGAGRKSDEAFSFAEIDADFRAYKVLRHQHTPEIAQLLSQYAAVPARVTFTAHLLPIKRGILSTSYARLTRAVSAAELTAVLRSAYHEEPFVEVLDSPEAVSLSRVVGTNLCTIGVSCEPEVGGRVVLVSAIDNLLKGAAGQAVQNLNLMLGCPEDAGLSHLRSYQL